MPPRRKEAAPLETSSWSVEDVAPSASPEPRERKIVHRLPKSAKAAAHPRRAVKMDLPKSREGAITVGGYFDMATHDAVAELCTRLACSRQVIVAKALNLFRGHYGLPPVFSEETARIRSDNAPREKPVKDDLPPSRRDNKSLAAWLPYEPYVDTRLVGEGLGMSLQDVLRFGLDMLFAANGMDFRANGPHRVPGRKSR